MLPRMMLLETAAHTANYGMAITVGAIAFATLAGVAMITMLFGSGRPHTTSK